MLLTSLSIRRPVFILMVVAALLVLGYYAYSRMNLELNPQVDFPFVNVTTIYPGAGPEEIETQVTKKVEDAVASISGVESITSSSQEGVSSVSIEFKLGTSSDVAAADVREKITAIRGALPADIEEPIARKFDVGAQPIMTFGVTGNRPSRDIRDMADNVIAPRLGKVSGVAAVSVSGGDIREISVGVRKERLDAYGIGIQQLVALIGANNLNFPVGHEIEGNREYSIRVVGEYRDLQALADTRLKMPSGQTVLLSDIADVRDTVAEQRVVSRINGDDSVALVVQKTSEGNTVGVAEGIKAEIEGLKKELPKDIRFITTQDTSIEVEEAVEDVRNSLFLGAFLAVLVVFLFLHNVRGTLIVATAIPTCVVATFLPMYAFGFTLNTMTMLALSLCVGILVDDSIVVLENIYRHLAKGEEPVEAAFNGRSEIGLAAITITLVDVVVFVPVAFMGGIVGQFFRSFGLTVAAATLFSLFMSFTLTPMLASRWYRSGEATEAERGLFGAVNRFYHYLDRIYRVALAWAVRYRGVVVFAGTGVLLLVLLALISSVAGRAGAGGLMMPFGVIMLVLAALLLWPYRLVGLVTGIAGMVGVFLAVQIGVGVGRPLINFRFAPDQDQGSVSITGELPAGTSLARTKEVVQNIEALIKDVPDIKYTFAQIGQASAGAFAAGGSGPQYFSLTLTLTDKVSLLDSVNPLAKSEGMRKRTDAAVADDVRARIGQVPGATIKVASVSGFGGGGGSPLQINLQGRDIEELSAVAQKVLAIFKEEPGVLNPDVTVRIGKPEQRIEIDRDKAASHGVSVAQVASALRTSIEGDTSNTYREGGNEYDIRVHFAEADRGDIDRVGDIVVATVSDPGTGASHPVRLSDVASIQPSTGPTKIDRLDRQRMVSVTANIQPGYAPGNMLLSINQKLENVNFGNATYSWGGENEITQQEGGYMGSALLLAVILVYMLMAALFDNLLYPLVIMISLPQAMVGALLGLMVAGHSLSIVAMIGIIMLVGLVTKNAILLVDYTNTLKARGRSRTDAILEAGPTRLRPIMMTTFAMIGGMLPTALGLGRGAEFRAPLATPVIGGLILSTLLTLLVIPCVYTYFDDFGRFFGRVVLHRRIRPEPASDAETAVVR